MRKKFQRYTRFLEDTTRVMERHNIHYIDINSYAEFAENEETLFCDMVHTNKKGHEVIARIINRYLENLQTAGAS